MVSRYSRRDEYHRVLFPVSWFHTGHRSRHHLAAVPRAYNFRALPEASRDAVALDLRHRRRDLFSTSIFSCWSCRHLKKFGATRDGPDADRTFIQGHAARPPAFGLLDHLLVVPNGITVPGLKLDRISDPLRASKL